MPVINHVPNFPISKLRPNPANVRTHSKKQLAQIARSIRQFGFTSPIVADEHGVILAGHGRWEAARQLGLRQAPVTVVSGLSDAARRAFALADNKIAENAGWNSSALAAELGELAPLLAEAGLDISLTGFDAPEIDRLLSDYVDPEEDPADESPQISEKAVSRQGDLWLLDPHRLLCGDAKDGAALRKLMGLERADMVFADPPYNVRVSSIQGRGKIRHPEFLQASGEMSSSAFVLFLKNSLSLAAKYSHPGSLHYVCIDWRHLRELTAAGDQVYSELLNLAVWSKSNAGQGSFYRSQHELIFVFKHGDVPHTNNIKLGRHGRNRSNVWTYAGVNTFRSGRLDDLSAHPTVKPVALVADAMRDCTRRGAIVLDPFMGSGTTVLAAERVRRRGYGLELDPLYVDTAIRRWEQFTKRDAVLAKTGQTFAEVAAARTGGKQK
jgi:ParB-like chromosome segregation protein Spo0J